MATPLDREFEARPGGCQRPSIHSSSSMNRPLQLHLAAFPLFSFGIQRIWWRRAILQLHENERKNFEHSQKIGRGEGGGSRFKRKCKFINFKIKLTKTRIFLYLKNINFLIHVLIFEKRKKMHSA